MKPLQKEQMIHIVKVSAYLALSAVLGYLTALVADTPEMFGIYAPFINIVLVALKQTLEKPE